MTEPTIPELVARLRELLSKAHPLPWLYRGKSDSLHTEPDEPPYSYGAGFLRLTEYDDGEATAEDIDLIVAAVNALPTLLDALERQPSRDSGGVEGAPCDTDGDSRGHGVFLAPKPCVLEAGFDVEDVSDE